MKHYEHVIWDWNGTLLNDVSLCVDVMNSMLRRRRLPPVDNLRYRQIFDFPVRTYYQALGFDFSNEPFEALAIEYCAAYDSRVAECVLQTAALTALDAVARTGAEQSVLSSCEQEALADALSHFALSDYFEAVIGQSDRHATGKLEAGKALLRRSRVPPSRTLLIGDTLHDHVVARALGLDCILVANGHHSRERLEAVHDVVLHSLEPFSPASPPPRRLATAGSGV